MQANRSCCSCCYRFRSLLQQIALAATGSDRSCSRSLLLLQVQIALAADRSCCYRFRLLLQQIALTATCSVRFNCLQANQFPSSLSMQHLRLTGSVRFKCLQANRLPLPLSMQHLRLTGFCLLMQIAKGRSSWAGHQQLTHVVR